MDGNAVFGMALGVLFSALGCLLAWQAPRIIREDRRRDAQMVRVTGEVVDQVMIPGRGSDSSDTWHPVVRFPYGEGQWHRKRLAYGTSPPRWEIGDSIQVAHPPGKPAEAVLDHKLALYMNSLGIIVFAGTSLLMGAALLAAVFFP